MRARLFLVLFFPPACDCLRFPSRLLVLACVCLCFFLRLLAFLLLCLLVVPFAFALFLLVFADCFRVFSASVCLCFRLLLLVFAFVFREQRQVSSWERA